MPKMRSCDFWIGKPGSMNKTLSFPGIRCVQAMNEPKEAATEPVVGKQARGDISISMKAFTKREAASFNSGTPAAAGYCDPSPLSRAAFQPRFLLGSPAVRENLDPCG